MGFGEIGSGVPAEQLTLLKSRNFGVRPLSTAGHLDTWRVLSLTWQPILIFVFTVVLLTATDFRYSGEAAVVVLYYLGLAALLLFPLLAVAVLLVGVAFSGSTARVRGSAVVFWTWWPFWRFVLCAAAAVLGTYIGDYVWHHQFYPHTRMQRLQAYMEVDPMTSSGKRLQDSGIVAFNSTAGVDRTRSGCLKNRATYCVAPILVGGEVSKTGQGEAGHAQDLFMAGLDCCGCPGEFRCGDWNVPGTLGGLRILGQERHDMFALAAQEWATTHGKVVKHPLFFEWVSDPVGAYNELYDRGMRIKMLALLAVPPAIVLVVVLLNGVLELLCRAGFAAPIQAPPQPPGLGRALASRFSQQASSHEDDGYDTITNPKYVIL